MSSLKGNTKHLILLTSLTFLNLLLSDQQVLGRIFSFIQLFLVIYLILRGKILQSLLLHVLFILTSVNISFPSEASETIIESNNYSKIDVFGIPIIIFINTLFFLITLKNKKCHLPKFKKFSNGFVGINLIALVLGIFGILFFEYSLHYFLVYLYYNTSLILLIEIFKKIPFDTYNSQLEKVVLTLLLSAPLGSLIFYLLGNTAAYGGLNIIPTNSVFLFTPLLLVVKNNYNFLIKTIFYTSLFTVSIFSLGGKGVIFLIIILTIFFYKIYSQSIKKNFYKVLMSMVLFILIFSLSGFIKSSFLSNMLIFHKFNQFISIFNFSIENIIEVSSSPRVRIAETLNILDSYIQNPIRGLFGFGYGGYFQDNLNLFSSIDLNNGAFDEDQISLGKFFRPHDSLPVVLLLYGSFGILFFIKWIWYLFKKAINNMNYLGVLPWLALTFGFDLNIGILGILFFVLSDSKEIL